MIGFFSKQLRSCDVRKVEGLTNPLTKEDIIMTSINDFKARLKGCKSYKVVNIFLK